MAAEQGGEENDMENNDNIFLVIKGAIAAVAGMYSAAFGVVGCLALVWVACMAVDYISGTAAACKDGEWSSAVAREGIYHKGGMILVVLGIMGEYVGRIYMCANAAPQYVEREVIRHEGDNA